MYFILLLIAYSIVYLITIGWLQLFSGEKVKIRPNIHHIVLITTLFISILFIVVSIPDAELANRVQHGLGGGFMVTYIVYLSSLVCGRKIPPFQLFHLLFFIAMTLGIINELAESIFQIKYGILFAPNIADTWYDLWANTVGALFGSGVFTYLSYKKGRKI